MNLNNPVLEDPLLSQEEKERTKRQKLIEGWNQPILKQSTVFIAGIGALGCEIAKDLALIGVGKLLTNTIQGIDSWTPYALIGLGLILIPLWKKAGFKTITLNE